MLLLLSHFLESYVLRGPLTLLLPQQDGGNAFLTVWVAVLYVSMLVCLWVGD